MNESEMGLSPDQLGINSEIEKNRKIKEQFLEPFSDNEISPNIDEIMNLPTLSLLNKKCVLERHLEDHKFMVYISVRDDNKYFDFVLLDPDNNKTAEIVFENLGSGTWDLLHRAVQTGAVGITGSEFLNKGEEYMKKITEKSSVTFDEVIAQASQVEVVNWLIKNGFDFSYEKDREAFLEFQSHPEDYELIEVQDMHEVENFEKGLFIFKKSEIEEYKIRYNQKSSSKNPLGLSEPRKIRLSHRRLLQLKGLVRFHLKKVINPDLAKPE